jgi:hypothetical protein
MDVGSSVRDFLLAVNSLITQRRTAKRTKGNAGGAPDNTFNI